MKNSKKVMRWGVPVLVLLLIVGYLLIDFFNSVKIQARNEVENSLMGTTEEYALKVHTELEMMTRAGVPVGAAILEYWGDKVDEDFAVKMLYHLKDNTSAYMIVLSDMQGSAVTDQGAEINVSEEAFFVEAGESEQEYLFAAESITGRNAIVSCIPLQKGDNKVGYLFMFYPQERFRDMIRKVEFDNMGFYAIVTDNGTIIESIGPPTSFLQNPNLLDTLSNAEIYWDSYERTKLRMNRLSSGTVGAQYLGERRELVYSPLNINTWHMVIGVNQTYLDRRQAQEREWTRSIVWKLVAALGIFLGLIIVSNITSKIRSDRHVNQLENKADMDLLTELSNKIATERKIKEYIAAHPEDEQGMLFVIDVDNFKKINDTMGHTFGDEVLRSLGLGLKAQFRMSDVVGRTGGDEFMVFLKQIKDANAASREISRMELFFKDFKAGDYVKYSVTASIGCALFPRDADNFEALYRAADKALYKAKKRGKNQIAMYAEEDESIDLEAEKRNSRS